MWHHLDFVLGLLLLASDYRGTDPEGSLYSVLNDRHGFQSGHAFEEVDTRLQPLLLAQVMWVSATSEHAFSSSSMRDNPLLSLEADEGLWLPDMVSLVHAIILDAAVFCDGLRCDPL